LPDIAGRVEQLLTISPHEWWINLGINATEEYMLENRARAQGRDDFFCPISEGIMRTPTNLTVIQKDGTTVTSVYDECEIKKWIKNGGRVDPFTHIPINPMVIVMRETLRVDDNKQRVIRNWVEEELVKIRNPTWFGRLRLKTNEIWRVVPLSLKNIIGLIEKLSATLLILLMAYIALSLHAKYQTPPQASTSLNNNAQSTSTEDKIYDKHCRWKPHDYINLDVHEKKDLSTFISADENCNGFLSKRELSKAGLDSRSEVIKFMKRYDSNNDDKISWEEFALEKRRLRRKEAELIFDMEVNGDCYEAHKRSLEAALPTISPAKWQTIVNALDRCFDCKSRGDCSLESILVYVDQMYSKLEKQLLGGRHLPHVDCLNA